MMTVRLMMSCGRHGAVSVEEEEKVKKKENSTAFHGAGFRLGDEEGPSQVVGNTRPLPPKPETVCGGVR